MKVPLLDLKPQYDDILPAIREAFEKIFAGHHYILGPEVFELESAIAEYCGVKHAIGCSSGTDALVLSLKAIDIQPGDEVITTPFTFFATAGSIHRVDGIPVFVDIDLRTFNLDVEQLEAAITEKTRAIIPVHLFGQMAKMDRIMELAQKYNLKVIEDTAQGIGAFYKNRTAGNYGDIATLSFFPSKNLGAMGDAGMCLTNDDELAEIITLLRTHGEHPKYIHKWVGLNSRLDSLQAAVLLVKLPKLAEWTRQRQENAAYYHQHMQDIEQIRLPYILPDAVSIYNQFTLLVQNRDELLQYLRDNEIGCNIYYPKPLHLQECFSYLHHQQGDFPMSEYACENVISIPIYSELTREQQDYVISKIREFYLNK
ncbi:MAG: DegT/DnrJ/EryC1/StrS family aminotransferase [Candidatus Cloacimonetes bacterium]|nr:DegT/DnrJ/EryC1/StrS family aminotransferase [Candidatus Cloacimonadota bacterium]